jgi:hypothetical protein
MPTNSRLINLYAKHPELTSLIKAIPVNEEITKAWLTLYESSVVAYTKKSLILRCLLGDERLIGKIDFIEDGYAAQCCKFFLYSDAINLNWLSGDNLSRKDTLPKHIANIAGINHVQPILFVQQWCRWLENELQHTSGNEELFNLIVQLKEHAVLKPLIMEKWFSNDPGKLGNGIKLFFKAEYTSNYLINSAVFIERFMTEDRRNGLLQSKIPVELSNLLGIERVSLTQLEIACDVINLVVKTIIPLYTIKTTALGKYLSGLEDVGIDLKIQFKWLEDYFLLDEVKALNVYEQYRTRGLGTHGTSYYFNMLRLTDKVKSADGFKVYYDQVQSHTLKEYVIKHYTHVFSKTDNPLSVFINQSNVVYVGVGIRDICNVLFYLYSLSDHGLISDRKDSHYSKAMPTVARWTAGEPEYQIDGYRSKSDIPIRARKKANESIIDLTQINRFIRIIESQKYIETVESIRVKFPDLKEDLISELVGATLLEIKRTHALTDK